MLGWTIAALLLVPSVEELKYEHEKPGFALTLPSTDWKKIDQSGGGAVVVVFSPDPQMAKRCTVLVLPTSMLQGGPSGRETAVAKAAGRAYQKIGSEPVEAFGTQTTRWEYRVGDATTIEWSFEDEGRYVIFQLAAPMTDWADVDDRAALNAIFASFKWRGGDVVVKKAPVDLTTPADVRALRAKNAALTATRGIEVIHHSIRATVDPEAFAFAVEDSIRLVGNADLSASLDLFYSELKIESVHCERPMKWSTASNPSVEVLKLEFDPPVAKGEEITIEVKAGTDDFLVETDQQLIAEIGVVGQVRPRSSWSSHVMWYPIDAQNDAAMDITFDVPEAFTAITGGALESDVVAAGRRRMRYVESVRVRRILPFGFAIANYASKATKSPAGLRMTVYGFEGEDTRIDQRITALENASTMLERALGPLPWSDVHFVHVTPTRLETGVSLPGMILVSDAYFPDLTDVDMSDGDLGNPRSLGLLVVADELSHQWNIYSAGLPNELGEGISTYTNALFVESLHGAAAYRKTLAACRKVWIGSAGGETEYAIANPHVYTNTRYRAVVFCKTPIVLDHLRRRLGDEKFFAGFRRGFSNSDPSVDGFDRLARGFSEACGADFGPFFEQWFFRAGFPTIDVAHSATPEGARVTVKQTQEEAPYELDVELVFSLEDGSSVSRTITSRTKDESFDLSLGGPAASMTIGNADVIPAKIAK